MLSPKAERKEFTRWLLGGQARPHPRWINLYRRALVCRTFPAYRLGDRMGPEVLQALDLLNIAEQIRQSRS